MKTIGNINTIASKALFVFILVLLPNVKSFAQTTPQQVHTVAVSGDSESDSQFELVSWLMATKQVQMGEMTGTSTSTNETGKKQFINNGLSTSPILKRTLLKKAMSREISVA
jgi:hypothetical protein